MTKFLVITTCFLIIFKTSNHLGKKHKGGNSKKIERELIHYENRFEILKID